MLPSKYDTPVNIVELCLSLGILYPVPCFDSVLANVPAGRLILPASFSWPLMCLLLVAARGHAHKSEFPPPPPTESGEEARVQAEPQLYFHLPAIGSGK